MSGGSRRGIALDPRDRRPLYVQVADEIASSIERGELAVGDRLPGIRDLARDLGVALVTVSRAYESLAARGRVVARVGKGTYVAAAAAPVAAERRWEPEIGSVARARLEGVRERIERARVPGAISLANGFPAPETFPLAEFARCLQKTLADDPPETMQYARDGGAGDAELREALARGLRARGVRANASEIIVCSGAQQAADIVASVIVEERAVIAAESPSYDATLSVFDARGATYVEVAADADGLRIDDVERVFSEYRPRLFYVNPFAQNPTGRILPQRRARAIVELARRYDVVVLEDQTGWTFTYDAPSPSPLAAYDTDGRVLVMESLSKSIFPALRVGYVLAKGSFAAAFATAKTRMDSFTSTLTQRALVRFLESPAYPRHLKAAKALYRARRDTFVAALDEAIPWAHVRPPEAGLTLWLPLPAHLTAAAAFTACANEGVVVMPADASYPTRVGPAALRLSFGDLDEPTAREGIARLARALERLRGARTG